MAERVFSVDFGTFYTKVALRTAPQETSNLVQLGPSSIDLWLPTVIAADWSDGKPQPELEFGDKAAGIKPGPKVAVYSNFKKDLFALKPAAAPAPQLHPLEALVQSGEFAQLAAKYSVLPEWVTALQVLVGSTKAIFGGPEQPAANPAFKRQEESRTLTYHFFRWVREQVLKACEKLPHTALSYKDIPIRVAVPVFGPVAELEQHPGCVRLREALAAAGWPLAKPLFVSEPESNVIGILTKGTNSLLPKTKRIHFLEMFNKGPLITVVKGDPHHPSYRAFLVDVGTYTTDFSALDIDTGGKAADTDAGVGFKITQNSIPFGISDLDASVRSALPDERRALLDALSRKDFAAFQISTYTDGTGYRIGPGKLIGGPADQDAVKKCLETFNARLAAETATFLQQLGPASMQELILTGGGNNIPAVRDALIKAAAATPGQPFVKMHAPGLKRVRTGTQLVDPLDDKFARGGSALGGASIYFEKAYY